MAIYSLGMVSSVAATNASYFSIVELKPPATTACSLLEIAMSGGSGSAVALQGGFPSTVGTPIGPGYTLAPDNPSDGPSLSRAINAWTVTPGAFVQSLRRHSTTAATNSGVIWSWPRGLKITPTKSFVVGSASAGFSFHLHMVINE